MARRRRTTASRSTGDYRHEEARRKNNPPATPFQQLTTPPQRSWVYQHSTLHCGACPASKPHLKLRFRRISQQTKHVRDITSIVLYQAEALDLAYIDGWVRTVNLADEWRTIQERIAEL